MTKPHEEARPSVQLGTRTYSPKFISYFPVLYPCSSVCIRGSKELSDSLR
jgi:hypothetical protein